MARHPGGERFQLELEALSDDVPPAVRLRRALKCLLRTFGLRCRGVAAVVAQLRTSNEPPADPPERSAPS
jgi:hypothetical protein